MFLQLAWRNIWRKKVRTGITIAAIAGAVFLSMAMRSMQLGSYDRMIENMTSLYVGNAQVHHFNYKDDASLESSFESSDELMQIVESNPVNADYSPRLESGALVSNDSGLNTTWAIVLGVDPEFEGKHNNLINNVVDGAFLQADDYGVVIGEGLAKNMKLSVGDEMIMVSQGYRGMNAVGMYPVIGIIKFPLPELNNKMVYMTLPVAQDFYGAYGMLTSITFFCDDDHTQELKSYLQSEFDEALFVVEDWRELSPELVQSIELDKVSNNMFLFLLYLIVCFGVFGTILMMTQERMYEMGVLISIGMKRMALGVVTFYEILMIGFLGVLVGTAFCAPILAYLHKNPIRFSEKMSEAYEKFGVEAILVFSIDPSVFYVQALVIFFAVLIISIYPIIWLLRLKPVQAMRS